MRPCAKPPSAIGRLHFRLQGDGLILSAEAYGPADGTPVLFFHGRGQGRGSWRGAARQVGLAGYRGITVDLRGPGESEWASDGDYLLDAYARDVEALIEAIRWPVVLVGASRSGQAALVGSARRADRVLLLVLADVAPLLHDPGIDVVRDSFCTSAGGFADADAAADALAHHLGRPRQPDASGLLKSMRKRTDGPYYWRWDFKTVSPQFFNPPSEGLALETAMAQISAPTVLVRAELSIIVTDESVARFRVVTPHLQVTEAKGVGHMFTGDRNEAFTATLVDHLACHELPSSAAAH